jgi:hypothetical protein
MTVAEVGWACGVCPKCGKKIYRKRPADYAICDCWQYCPKGHKMEPYTPDLTLQTYRPIDSTKAYGDLQHPMKIVMWCPICNYYSAQLPIEVSLT